MLGARCPAHIIMGPRLSETEASVNNTSTVLFTLTLGDGCGLLQNYTASSSSHRWQAPLVFSEVNAIIISFDSYAPQLRDMGMNRLIFFSSPDLKIVLHTEWKRNATTAFTYLSGRVDLHNKQKYIFIYSILILYAGYLMDCGRLTNFIFAYLKCFIPRCSSSPHRLKHANAFSSAEYTPRLAIRSYR